MKHATSISLDSYLNSHSEPAALSSERRRWPGMVVTFDRFQPFQQSLHCYREHLICINMGGKAGRLTLGTDSQNWQGLVRRGQCLIVPAAQPVRWELETAATGLSVLLDPTFLQQYAVECKDMNPDKVELLAKISASDTLMWHLGSVLYSELQSGGVSAEDLLLAERLALTLAAHLLRSYSTRTPRNQNQPAKISAPRIRKVLGHISDNLHTPTALTLEVLAEVASVSRFYFSRLFKEATGFSPHHWIIRERVERAKLLLGGHQERPLAEIAFEVGFCDQGHLCKHFKQSVGVTPDQYRKDLG